MKTPSQRDTPRASTVIHQAYTLTLPTAQAEIPEHSLEANSSVFDGRVRFEVVPYRLVVDGVQYRLLSDYLDELLEPRFGP